MIKMSIYVQFAKNKLQHFKSQMKLDQQMVKQGSDLTFGSVVKHQTRPGWLLKFLCVREIYISVLGYGHFY